MNPLAVWSFFNSSDQPTTAQQASTAFLAGTKNLRFLTPPTLNKPSPRKSSSVFVESNGIVRLMPFIQNVASREPFLRRASEHPNEALFQKGSWETTMSSSYGANLLHHLSELLLFLSTGPLFWFSINLSYDHDCMAQWLNGTMAYRYDGLMA